MKPKRSGAMERVGPAGLCAQCAKGACSEHEHPDVRGGRALTALALVPPEHLAHVGAVYVRAVLRGEARAGKGGLEEFVELQANNGLVWIFTGPTDSEPGWESRWPWSEPVPFRAVLLARIAQIGKT